MKNLMFLFLFTFSQFAFSQTGEDVNTIYIECEGDSIAVDVSQFSNLPPELLFEMFDCSDVDDWSWGDDSTDVNNPWDEEDDDFWGFDSTDVNNPWDEEELAFDCINSSPEAFELYLSCMNGDEGACEALEMLCGGEEEGEEEEEWGDDIDALIEQLENDCASQVDLGWSCGMLEMIYSCMNGSEDTCLYLEELYEDFDFEEGEEEEEEEWGDDIDALIEQLETDCASQNDLGESCGILEMIYSCMNGSEDTCSYLEEFYEDFDFEEGEENEEEEFDCINSSPEAFELYLSCMNGDEGACEALEMLCGGEEEGEEEEEWGDDIDALIEQLENDCASQVDLGWSCGMLEMIYSCMNGSEDTCLYLEELYEDFDFEEGEEEEEEEWSWGEGENMGALFDAISSINVTENELVLVLEANDLIVSVFDQFGFEFLPSLVDGYMVFGPFDIDELYNIIVENMDDLEVLWGLFRPITSDIELIKEGVFSAFDSNFGDIFNLNSMVSVGEVHQDFKIYNTQYYDLMGRKVSNPSKGLYIEVQTTNIGEISTKIFILK